MQAAEIGRPRLASEAVCESAPRRVPGHLVESRGRSRLPTL